MYGVLAYTGKKGTSIKITDQPIVLPKCDDYLAFGEI